MRNLRLKWANNEKGLTLIELLAVVVVLGIIALIAVPAIQGTITSQKEKADEQTVNIIEEAAQRYVYDVAPSGLADAATSFPDGITRGTGSGNYVVAVSTLSANGYLTDDGTGFQSQADPDVSFISVDVHFDSTTGWTIEKVNTSGS